MGAGISSFSAVEGESPGPGLGDIPEGCAASVLVHLSPTDICRLALLSQSFRRAASADFVWESKLPKNYRYLVDKLFGDIPADFSKKDIYARLCRPIPFDGSTKVVWMEKSSGGICMSISAKALSITGIDDRRYWKYIPTEESRFHTVAYLQQTWWFQVEGKVEFCFPAGTYSLFFRIQLGRTSKRFGRRVCNTEQVHGWDKKPVHFQLSTSDGQHAPSSQYYLEKPGDWIHYHVGDFVVEHSDALTKLKFSMTQIDCTHTKGGLCVDSVLIYPSEFREKGKG